MTPAEEGVLLLCCPLGDPQSRPLTMAQFRELSLRVQASSQSGNPMSELQQQDLLRLHYSQEQADRIMTLLGRQDRLRDYLAAGERYGIYPVTRISKDYPIRIAARLRTSCPPVLFCRGPKTLLEQPAISLVGSRKIATANAHFAAAAGKVAAREGQVLVSGGAVGADQIAQKACLVNGGSVIVFTPDTLLHPMHDRVLVCSVDGYDLGFTAPRALYRNRLIHIQGEKTLVAQVHYGKGGSWQGSMDNLKHGWSPLFVYADGSEGMTALVEQGAIPVHNIEYLADLQPEQQSIF